MKNTAVGLSDKQHGKVMALVKKHRVLSRVRNCGILYSSPTPPDPLLILEKIELFLPLLEVFVSYYRSLTLEDPQLFRCQVCSAVASSPIGA